MKIRKTSVWGRAGDRLVVRGVLGSWGGRAGLVLVVAIVLLALLGPFVSPWSPTEIVGLPLSAPSVEHPLGTDTLGRDALARFLHGGGTLVLVAASATLLAYVAGIPVGMGAGYRGGAMDFGALGFADLILSFPPIVFVLVLLAALGPQLSVVIIGIAVIHMPRVVRISRSVTIEISRSEYLEAALARGEGLSAILLRDVLPNILTPVLADFGVRLTGSIILFSSLSYLGLGQPPPAADWGLMISENRVALLVQPWVLIVPALTIALLTIGANLIADGIARSVGRSVASRDA